MIFLIFFFIFNFISTDKTNLETVLKLNRINFLNETINRIQREHGLIFKRILLDKYYIFEIDLLTIHRIKKRQLYEKQIDLIELLETKLKNDTDIEWHEIQKSLLRHIRYDSDASQNNNNNKTFRFDYLFGNSFNDKVTEDEFDYFFEMEHFLKHQSLECKKSKFIFDDPEWPKQWHMNEGCSQGYNLNITGAWKLGFTGKNIVVTIIDDGIEKDHEELIDNYDSFASIDLNDRDANPQPRYDPSNQNNHGTRCAGQVAAKANNSKCSVGIAYNSRIGGIRLLDGQITDVLEAEALAHNLNHIDIFSSSWGPPDDGQTVDGPGEISKAALLKGIKSGRNGKGTIYVWAAGNGGRSNDNCNCDGYASSIYTITIAGVTYEGFMPSYSERCSATLASTFSSGHKSTGIVTSDLHNGCTLHHTGTSASAPTAAGIIALTLEANSKLTWRDIQYLIIHTSDSFKLKAKDWQKNGNGKIFSHNYGFGLMNAGRMVEWALKWPLVEPQLNFKLIYQFNTDHLIKRKKTFSFFIAKNDQIKQTIDNALIQIYKPFITVLNETKLTYLEHVISHISLEGGIRGKIKINLISPFNTTSNLLELRRKDMSRKGFDAWPFMSVYYWGETLYGLWRLEIINLSNQDIILKKWHLEFFGVENKII